MRPRARCATTGPPPTSTRPRVTGHGSSGTPPGRPSTSRPVMGSRLSSRTTYERGRPPAPGDHPAADGHSRPCGRGDHHLDRSGHAVGERRAAHRPGVLCGPAGGGAPARAHPAPGRGDHGRPGDARDPRARGRPPRLRHHERREPRRATHRTAPDGHGGGRVMDPVIWTLIWLVVILVVAYAAHYIITTFFPPPIHTPALLIVGLILLIVIVAQLLGWYARRGVLP